MAIDKPRRLPAYVGSADRPRTRGTGSIQVREVGPKGRKQLIFYAVVRENGKPKWHRVGPDADEARRTLTRLLGEQEQRRIDRSEAPARSSGQERWSFEQFSHWWLDRRLAGAPGKRPRKETTQADYRRIVTKALVPFFGELPIARIAREDIELFIEARMAGSLPAHVKEKHPVQWKPVTRRTAISEMSVLGVMLHEAMLSRGHDPLDPCRFVVRATKPQQPRKPLTRDEVERLIHHAPRDERLLLLLLAVTGVRLGEALALKWSDFNADTKALTIQRTWHRGRIGTPKTENSSRTFRLPDDLAAALEARRPGPTRRTGVGGGMMRQVEPPPPSRNPDGWMFPGSSGKPKDPSWWREKVFHPAVASAGLINDDRPIVVPHSLRHTAAHLMLEAGRPMAQVQAALGHTAITTTMDLYGKRTPADFPEAAGVSGLAWVAG